jgi:hypothetical protein
MRSAHEKEFAMDARLPVTAELSLPRQQVLRLTHAEGARLCPTSGTVWITQDGDPRDWILDPGECLVVEGAAPVMVQAFVDARFEVRPAAPALLAA